MLMLSLRYNIAVIIIACQKFPTDNYITSCLKYNYIVIIIHNFRIIPIMDVENNVKPPEKNIQHTL